MACRVTHAPASVTPLPATEAPRSRPPARAAASRAPAAGAEEPARGTRVSPPRAGPRGWVCCPGRLPNFWHGWQPPQHSLPSAPRRGARRRGSPLVRRILTVETGLAEQLPASAAAPAAGRAGGEVRPGPSPPAQSGSAKFWCACPCPIGALPSTRDPSPPEGRARADGPGEAAPSLPVAERPAALRCRPALRRTLFPLPGVSPAIRNPEAVSPRSVSPPGRQQPGKSPQQQGQGCGRSLSRAAGKPRSGGTERARQVSVRIAVQTCCDPLLWLFFISHSFPPQSFHWSRRGAGWDRVKLS